MSQCCTRLHPRVGARSSESWRLENQVGERKETQTTKLWWLNPEDVLLAQIAMKILEETSLSPEGNILELDNVL